jgi:hypothetical protein
VGNDKLKKEEEVPRYEAEEVHSAAGKSVV